MENTSKNLKKALTIAGSDCSGGAGLLADIKTFQERDVFGMCAITVLVSMDPATWAHRIHPVDMPTISEQIETTLDGIGVDALKTGMLPTAEIIRNVGAILAAHKAPHVVIDPVMVCKGTNVPVFPENTRAMIEALMPVAEVTTPNTFEAAQLAGMDELKTIEDCEMAARRIHQLGARNVIVKAARIFPDCAADLLYDGAQCHWIRSPRIDTAWTHGAGCTFSACVTAELAKGAEVREAFNTAHDFLQAALRGGFPFNEFTGPVYHKAYAKLHPGL